MVEDSNDSLQSSSGFSNTNRRGVPPSQVSQSAAPGGLQYASSAGHGKRMDQARARTNYSAFPDMYRGGSSSSESSEDEKMPSAGDAAPTGGQGMGMEHATLTRRPGLSASLPPWIGPDDFSLLSQYAVC